MRRSQKKKSVSWASDVSLCQIRFFCSEKSSSPVVPGTDYLQKKISSDNEADDNCPPGFGRIQPANLLKTKLPQLPLIKWRRPIRFEVNNQWEVVAGEESKEVAAQSQREMSVLEAIYPRPSSIPPNPCGFLNVEGLTANDRDTPPVIPLTPIEDRLLNVEGSTANDRDTPPVIPPTPIEEDDATPLHASLNSPTPISQPQLSQAVLTSILLNSGLGNLVDRELLIKILNNPEIVEQLASSHHASSVSQNLPSTGIQNKPSKVTQHIPPSLRPPTNNVQMSKGIPNRPFYPPPLPPTPAIQIRPPASPLMKKDINYYKSLIQQHGIERQDGSLMSPGQNLNLVNCRESKQRSMIPCVYYNSPKGCRNGTNCTYQHDVSSRNGFHGFPDVHNAKRLKLDREIPVYR